MPAVHKPRIVIHCGLPKTGTTSLQASFRFCAEAYAKEGIIYPMDSIDTRESNHSWISAGLRTGSIEGLEANLKAHAKRDTTLFLSDESLFVEMPGLSGLAMQKLSSLLSEYNVTLVSFERETEAWKRSFYKQSVQNRRRGPTLSYPTARSLWQTPLKYGPFFDQPFCQALTDFDAMERLMRVAFAADEVKRISYEQGRDVVELLCAEMGWPYFEDRPSLELNPSLTDAECELLRQANRLAAPKARFIKAMLELRDDTQITQMRPRRRKRLASHVKGVRWALLKYEENHPLDFDRADFEAAKAKVQQRAQAVLKA